MIFTHIAYRTDANLGRAYNDFMELLPTDAWGCFIDHDAMLTTGQWHAQLTEAIAFKPDAGAFVAMTNRCARNWQRCDNLITTDDVAWHRRFGAVKAARDRTLLDISETRGFAGVMFALSKDTWSAVGGFADGLGCVDHSLHFKLQAAGRQVWLVEGLYVYHWRHADGPDPTEHYIKAPNCPCMRIPDKQPTQRIALP